MKNNIIFGSIIFLIGVLFGFGLNIMEADVVSPGEIQITDACFSMGLTNASVENNSSHQSYSYNINMLLGDAAGRSVNSVQVNFTYPFSEIVTLNRSDFTVNNSNNSDLIINLTGEVEFNATGLSKKDILELDPYISHIIISSEELLELS